MKKNMKPTMIGLFVIGALVLALTAFTVLGVGMFREKQTWVAFFDSSVKGLNTGAPVAFRGVNVGSVTDIQLRIDEEDVIYRIPVFFEIEPARLSLVGKDRRAAELDVDRLIERGLRAQLAIQSFVTGLLMVELDFRPETPERIIGTIEDYPEIPTVPSDLEDFLRRFDKMPIEELLHQITNIAENIGEFVDSPYFKDSLRNLSHTLEGMNVLVRTVEEHLEPFLSEGKLTLQEFRQNTQELTGKMATLSDSLASAVETVHSVARVADTRLPSVMAGLEETIMVARETLDQTHVTVKTFEDAFHGDSPVMYQLQDVLSEVAAASRSMRVLADYLQQHPEALVRGKRP